MARFVDKPVPQLHRIWASAEGVIVQADAAGTTLDHQPYTQSYVCVFDMNRGASLGPPSISTWGVGRVDAPKGQADGPWALPKEGLPPGFATLVPEIAALPSVVRVVKRQMSAFFGTELDVQLRRRECDTVVICGVATNLGVEATARAAFELNYNVVIAEDACSSIAPGLHEFAVEKILPRIARVRSTAQILEAISGR